MAAVHQALHVRICPHHLTSGHLTTGNLTNVPAAPTTAAATAATTAGECGEVPADHRLMTSGSGGRPSCQTRGCGVCDAHHLAPHHMRSFLSCCSCTTPLPLPAPDLTCSRLRPCGPRLPRGRASSPAPAQPSCRARRSPPTTTCPAHCSARAWIQTLNHCRCPPSVSAQQGSNCQQAWSYQQSSLPHLQSARTPPVPTVHLQNDTA
jgi:hypothetical protein